MQTGMFLTAIATIAVMTWFFIYDLKPTDGAFNWFPAMSLILDQQPSED